jgi:ElaB/YqjD/DUF883 family membrane-anchored ribosome-binding protein
MPHSKQDPASNTQEIFEHATTLLTDNAEMIKEEVSDFVKKHPLASLAVAAGVGFLLAKLLSGKNRS